MEKKYIITIIRQYESGGRHVGKALASELGIQYYDSDIFEDIEKLNLPEKVHKSIDKMIKRETMTTFERLLTPQEWNDRDDEENVFQSQRIIMRYLAEQQSCVFVGRCADFILADMENVIRIFIYAPYELRVKHAMEDKNVDEETARKIVVEYDKERRDYYRQFTGYEPGEFGHYDIMIDSGLLGSKQTAHHLAEIIKEYFQLEA